MKERWKSVKGYEGLYEVSDCGRIRSLDRNVKIGNYRKINLKGKIRKLDIDKNGYKSIILGKLGLKKGFRVHRLVAQAFIPNPDNKPFINHKNGIKDDNYYKNLEWATAKENTKHGYDTKLINCYCEKHYKTHLKNKDIINIKKMLNEGIFQKIIAKKYNVGQTTISYIKLNKSWKRLEASYENGKESLS